MVLAAGATTASFISAKVACFNVSFAYFFAMTLPEAPSLNFGTMPSNNSLCFLAILTLLPIACASCPKACITFLAVLPVTLLSSAKLSKFLTLAESRHTCLLFCSNGFVFIPLLINCPSFTKDLYAPAELDTPPAKFKSEYTPSVLFLFNPAFINNHFRILSPYFFPDVIFV